jgi:dihydroneopterin aldolase
MTVALEGVKFFARHGVLPQERVVGNEFEVSLEVVYAAPKVVNDSLDCTISYADLYDIVAARMGQPAQLLERVAWCVAEDVRLRYPQVLSVSVKISKLAPPILGMDGSASVKFDWKK